MKRKMTDEEKRHMKEVERRWIKENFTEEYGLVYDFGCGQFNPRKLIKHKRFISIDKIKHKDYVMVLDLEKLHILDRADLILCNDMLEHVWDVKTVIDNVFLNLKFGGYASIIIPYMFEYHGNEIVPDYWRFTPEAARRLFEKFEITKIEILEDDKLIGLVVRKKW